MCDPKEMSKVIMHEMQTITNNVGQFDKSEIKGMFIEILDFDVYCPSEVLPNILIDDVFATMCNKLNAHAAGLGEWLTILMHSKVTNTIALSA